MSSLSHGAPSAAAASPSSAPPFTAAVDHDMEVVSIATTNDEAAVGPASAGAVQLVPTDVPVDVETTDLTLGATPLQRTNTENGGP